MHEAITEDVIEGGKTDQNFIEKLFQDQKSILIDFFRLSERFSITFDLRGLRLALDKLSAYIGKLKPDVEANRSWRLSKPQISNPITLHQLHILKTRIVEAPDLSVPDKQEFEEIKRMALEEKNGFKKERRLSPPRAGNALELPT
jgi:hypothetical protein